MTNFTHPLLENLSKRQLDVLEKLYSGTFEGFLVLCFPVYDTGHLR
jgi:hypothetical protein